MPQRSGNYIRAAVSDRRGMSVKGEAFDAISVEVTIRRITLQVGGLATARGKDFNMPADPALLRDLAEALRMAAADV